MGKAARLKNRAGRPRRRKVPGIPDSPYADAFTQEEWNSILERKDWLIRFFRDAVKVTDGTVIGIDEATLQLLVLHFALAGGTQDDDLALIRPKILPDENGRLVDATEWIPLRFDSEAARAADAEAEAEARKRAFDVQVAQMGPDARKAFERKFLPAATEAFTVGAQSAARRLEDAEDETDEAKALREQAARLREEGKL